MPRKTYAWPTAAPSTIAGLGEAIRDFATLCVAAKDRTTMLTAMKVAALAGADELVMRYPALAELRDLVVRAATMLRSCQQFGGTVLFCGNDSTAAEREDVVGKLMTGLAPSRKSISKRCATRASKTGCNSAPSRNGSWPPSH